VASQLGLVRIGSDSAVRLIPLLHHRERNMVQRWARQRKEIPLNMWDLQARANLCNA
jgi:hypothetical protein